MPYGVYDRTKSKPNCGMFTKNKASWNKGKRCSDETKEKMRISHADFSGANHPRWKGGRFVNARGRVWVYQPEHPSCTKNGYMAEHRLVMEKHLGRYLTPEEVVHHKGAFYPIESRENRGDNTIENLQLFANKSEHRKYHHFLESQKLSS